MVALDKKAMRRESLIGVAFGGGIGRPSRSCAGGLIIGRGRLCLGVGKGSDSMRVWIRFASVSGSGGSVVVVAAGGVLPAGSSSSATMLKSFAWPWLGPGDVSVVPLLLLVSGGWISPKVTLGDEGTPLSAFLSLAPNLFNLSPMLMRVFRDELLLTVLSRGSPGVETSTPLSADGVAKTDASAGGGGEEALVVKFLPLRVRIKR